MIQSELLKSQFEVLAKKKAATFRSHCLTRADKHGIDRALVPMPREFEQWLLTYQNKAETLRGRFYLRCEYTGELVKLDDIQIDHKTPVSRGGSFAVDNLAITSGQVNQWKGELIDNEFSSLLELLNQFEPVAKKNVLSRLRSGGVNRFRR